MTSSLWLLACFFAAIAGFAIGFAFANSGFLKRWNKRRRALQKLMEMEGDDL